MRLDRYTSETAGKFSIIENRKNGRIVNIVEYFPLNGKQH